MRKVFAFVLVLSIAIIGTTSAQQQGLDTINATHVHENYGVDGDGVKVGIVDNYYNKTNVQIEDNIVATKSFTNESGVFDKSDGHGTLVADILTATAPGIDIYAAALPPEGSDLVSKFNKSVDWFIDNNVDVVVCSCGFTRQPSDGSGEVGNITQKAWDNGTLVVASSGNHGQRHWQGSGNDTDGDDWVEFKGNQEDLNITRVNDGNLTVKLRWNEWNNLTNDYDLYLKRYSDDSVIAKDAFNQTSQHDPFESIDHDVPNGTNAYLAVKQREVSDPQTIEIYTGNFEPELKTPNGSILAPATSKHIVSVGAVDYHTLRIEPFSSRGPLVDGRQGVDVVAPDNVRTRTQGVETGTSISAPFVAGGAALLIGVDNRSTSDDLESVILNTATNLNDSPNNIYGNGLFSASASFEKYLDDVDDEVSISVQSGNMSVKNNTGSFNLTFVNASATPFEGERVLEFTMDKSQGVATVEINGLAPSRGYIVYEDGESWKELTTDVDGRASFRKLQNWSEHTYVINTSTRVTGSSSDILATLAMIVVLFGGVGFVVYIVRFRKRDSKVRWD